MRTDGFTGTYRLGVRLRPRGAVGGPGGLGAARAVDERAVSRPARRREAGDAALRRDRLHDRASRWRPGVMRGARRHARRRSSHDVSTRSLCQTAAGSCGSAARLDVTSSPSGFDPELLRSDDRLRGRRAPRSVRDGRRPRRRLVPADHAAGPGSADLVSQYEFVAELVAMDRRGGLALRHPAPRGDRRHRRDHTRGRGAGFGSRRVEVTVGSHDMEDLGVPRQERPPRICPADEAGRPEGRGSGRGRSPSRSASG